MSNRNDGWDWTWDDTGGCVGCVLMLILAATACRIAWKILVWSWA